MGFMRAGFLLLMLLAMFMGQPVEHCGVGCSVAYCHAVEHGESPAHGGSAYTASSHEGHHHLPCIHLSEGEALSQASVSRPLLGVAAPPAQRWAPVLYRAASSSAVCSRAVYVPPPGCLCLPMLC